MELAEVVAVGRGFARRRCQVVALSSVPAVAVAAFVVAVTVVVVSDVVVVEAAVGTLAGSPAAVEPAFAPFGQVVADIVGIAADSPQSVFGVEARRFRQGASVGLGLHSSSPAFVAVGVVAYWSRVAALVTPPVAAAVVEFVAAGVVVAAVAVSEVEAAANSRYTVRWPGNRQGCLAPFAAVRWHL